jgi:hypothetical protein
MRIAAHFLKEIIDNDGRLKDSPIGQHAVLRMALDLREATEKIAEIESTLALRDATPKARPKKGTLALVTEEVVTGRFGDPRRDGYEEHSEIRDVVPGKKVDYRA